MAGDREGVAVGADDPWAIDVEGTRKALRRFLWRSRLSIVTAPLPVFYVVVPFGALTLLKPLVAVGILFGCVVLVLLYGGFEERSRVERTLYVGEWREWRVDAGSHDPRWSGKKGVLMLLDSDGTPVELLEPVGDSHQRLGEIDDGVVWVTQGKRRERVVARTGIPSVARYRMVWTAVR